jgi:hypothetical protein
MEYLDRFVGFISTTIIVFHNIMARVKQIAYLI